MLLFHFAKYRTSRDKCKIHASINSATRCLRTAWINLARKILRHQYLSVCRRDDGLLGGSVCFRRGLGVGFLSSYYSCIQPGVSYYNTRGEIASATTTMRVNIACSLCTNICIYCMYVGECVGKKCVYVCILARDSCGRLFFVIFHRFSGGKFSRRVLKGGWDLSSDGLIFFFAVFHFFQYNISDWFKLLLFSIDIHCKFIQLNKIIIRKMRKFIQDYKTVAIFGVK